jgi:hypothetical protein
MLRSFCSSDGSRAAAMSEGDRNSAHLAATLKEGNHVGIHKSNRTRSHRWGTERPAVRGSHTGEGNAGVFGEAKTGPGVTGVSFSSVPC